MRLHQYIQTGTPPVPMCGLTKIDYITPGDEVDQYLIKVTTLK